MSNRAGKIQKSRFEIETKGLKIEFRNTKHVSARNFICEPGAVFKKLRFAETSKEVGRLAHPAISAYPSCMWILRLFSRRTVCHPLLGATLLLSPVLLVSTSAANAQTNTPPAAANATNLSRPQPYTRIANPDTNTVQLQIAVRKFVPAGKPGPTIWLAGTSHVGEPQYYQALQKHLDAQTVVLFEGINADAHPHRVPKPGQPPVKAGPPETPTPAKSTSTNEAYSMQTALAKSLGLVFQLDAINYDRTNFLNSDLSAFDIQKLMLGDPDAEPAAPGEKGVSSPTFDMLLQIMDGTSFLGNIFKWVIKFIGSDPQMQASAKFTLIEALGRMKGDFAAMRGLPPDMQQLLKVLIEARNQNVIDDLKTELAVVPATGSIAVFYGTGHMDDMERRVIKDLGYRPDGDLWFTAFSVDLRATGMSPGDLQSMRRVIKWELDMMMPESTPEPGRVP
jgi:hypothetical protein